MIDLESEPDAWKRALARGCLSDRTSDHPSDDPKAVTTSGGGASIVPAGLSHHHPEIARC